MIFFIICLGISMRIQANSKYVMSLFYQFSTQYIHHCSYSPYFTWRIFFTYV
ncbi:MAG TPA: hypothetical protein PLA61_11330 [Ferruginibacter sp.]|nr:hypothetical protein [Ferruginibacter sp.]